jgi:hypothetical protein
VVHALIVRFNNMKRLLAATFSILCAAGCASNENADSPTPEFVGGCSHDHELPPLKLEAADTRLLASRSSKPLKTADQRKFIWLSYDLPISGNVISITGRENFMDPSETYVWRRFGFNGERFTEKTNSESGPRE